MVIETDYPLKNEIFAKCQKVKELIVSAFIRDFNKDLYIPIDLEKIVYLMCTKDSDNYSSQLFLELDDNNSSQILGNADNNSDDTMCTIL